MSRLARLALGGLLAATSIRAGERSALSLRHVTLDLPGPPSKIVAHDLDGDGRRDLAVVVAYSEVEEIGEERVEELVHVTTVIPALFERRELRVYLSGADGELHAAGAPLPLAKSVLHLERGPDAVGLVTLTDEGLSRVVFDPHKQELRLEPLIAEPPVLARTGSFQARLELMHDLDGDGDADLLLPAREGPAVYLSSTAGLATEPISRVAPPPNPHSSGPRAARWYSWPDVVHVDGDTAPDLVFRSRVGDQMRVHVLLGSGDGRFRPLRAVARDCHDVGSDLRLALTDAGTWPWPDDLVELRDLDGDRRAEAVIRVSHDRGEGMRKEMKDAKRPVYEYRFHKLTEDLALAAEPYHKLSAEGHPWADESSATLPSAMRQFQDLDGDGRLDLVTVTLDFSLLQAVRVLATRRISIGLDFHVWAQAPDGSFRPISGLDLSEKLKFDLGNLEVGRFGQFAGDFDGDGRQEFAHFGRGREVTIHSGRPGCTYPTEPDLVIELEEEPASLDLIRAEDLDGDGRADLRVTRLLPQQDIDATAPVRLDLYLSRSGS